MKRHPSLFYFPLESVKSRYCHQLCNPVDGWMPTALDKLAWAKSYYLNPIVATPPDIKTGAVLDAVGRSIYSMRQVEEFLRHVEEGHVKDNDVLYFQDFWTPGIEAIYYTLHLHGIKVRSYAMLHAQSVDQWDFTHEMLPWIRFIERGYATEMDGIFVASSVHKTELQNAGWDPRKIHVVGLPFGMDQMEEQYGPLLGRKKSNQVIFSSRIDREKKPEFMLDIAEQFLLEHPDWNWVLTTSAAELRSYNNQSIVKDIRRLAEKSPRFQIAEGLTKAAYYDMLARSKIHFNCSLQDYVSWTLIESQFFGCHPVFPNFRSFPECLKGERLYTPWEMGSALKLLAHKAKETAPKKSDLPELMNTGRHVAAHLAYTGSARGYNIWEDNT